MPLVAAIGGPPAKSVIAAAVQKLDSLLMTIFGLSATRLEMLMEDASTPALLKDSSGGILAERIILLEIEITRMKSISGAEKHF